MLWRHRWPKGSEGGGGWGEGGWEGPEGTHAGPEGASDACWLCDILPQCCRASGGQLTPRWQGREHIYMYAGRAESCRC